MNGLKRGALIVFEGCDRCGKTTQCTKLIERLLAEGKKVELLKFPGNFFFEVALLHIPLTFSNQVCSLNNFMLFLI